MAGLQDDSYQKTVTDRRKSAALRHSIQRENYELIAFGDSRGDRELLAYADKAFYKPFRNKKRNAGNRYEA